MAQRKSHLTMTGDDLRAARVLTLAVKFFASSRPVSSASIRNDLYPKLEEDAFRRQFLRDRELLASFGIVTRQVEGAAEDSYWQVDEGVSYVQGTGLGPRDARVLYLLCHDLADDQSFAYRDELRMALAKVSLLYRGNVVSHPESTPVEQHKLLSVLVSCMTGRHAVLAGYTDARGVQSERRLAILGSFGLRDHTYFVASRVGPDGELVSDTVRTYRLDRFTTARKLARIRYQVPLDFSVDDYQHLPFQLGDARGTARFALPESRTGQLSRAIASYGSCHEDHGAEVWELPYSDPRAAASWAIAEQLTPLEPAELVSSWRGLLQAAAASRPFDALLAARGRSARSPRAARGRGRTGSVTTARRLIALASNLTLEGEPISADDIAGVLGISYDEARHLIALVSMGSGESIDYLPVILGEQDREVALMEGARMAARPVRLTPSETVALLVALREMGVGLDDPLYQLVVSSHASPAVTEHEIASRRAGEADPAVATTLRQCSQAMADGDQLGFSYRPVQGGGPHDRRVVPRMLRHSDGSWYLDAYDLVRQAPRVFRVDRMSELAAVPGPAAPDLPPTKGKDKELVVLFTDRRYLDLFHWEGLRLLSEDERGTAVALPWYGGSWLPRHLAACAGTVAVSDEELARQLLLCAREAQEG